MKHPTFAAHDPQIIDALRTGLLTSDPATGQVCRDGRPVGHLSQGYVRLELHHNPRVPVLAHRVVWIDANGPIPDDLQINHRNRIRRDNRLSNLEVVTARENIGHAFDTAYYNRVRDEDLAAVDPEWLARVLALAASGEVPTAELAALLPASWCDTDRNSSYMAPGHSRWGPERSVLTTMPAG